MGNDKCLSRNSLLGDYTGDIAWKDELGDGVERKGAMLRRNEVMLTGAGYIAKESALGVAIHVIKWR